MSPNKEDYLKSIYELSHFYQKLTNKTISEHMKVSAPAVSEMIKKLQHDNLVEPNTKQGVQLTHKGLIAVSQVIRKHRLIEVFLLNHLKYNVEDIHEEAEILEHAVSEQFIDYLDNYLGSPKECPHGAIIPRKNEILVESTIALTHAASDTTYIIKKTYQDKRLNDYLDNYHLTVGSEFTVINNDSFSQQVTIHYQNNPIILSYVIASQIFVDSK